MERLTDEKTAMELLEKKKRTANQDLYLALFEKENAEEKLLMPVDLLNKVMDSETGFYVKFTYDKAAYIYHVRFKYITQSRVIWYDTDYYYVDNEFIPTINTGCNGVLPNEYGKTWAFTREYLEDDLTKKSMAEIYAKQEAKRNDPIIQFKSSIAHISDKEANKMLMELKQKRKQIGKELKHNDLKYIGAASGKFGEAAKEVSDLRKQYDLLEAKIEILKKYC